MVLAGFGDAAGLVSVSSSQSAPQSSASSASAGFSLVSCSFNSSSTTSSSSPQALISSSSSSTVCFFSSVTSPSSSQSAAQSSSCSSPACNASPFEMTCVSTLSTVFFSRTVFGNMACTREIACSFCLASHISADLSTHSARRFWPDQPSSSRYSTKPKT